MALIRQALGSIREPISQEALGELVEARTGASFDKYKISRIERGAQELSRADAIAIASVDPLQRGPAWLMFSNESENPARPSTNIPDDLTPPLEMFREIQTGDDLRRALGEPTKKQRRGNGDDVG